MLFKDPIEQIEPCSAWGEFFPDCLNEFIGSFHHSGTLGTGQVGKRAAFFPDVLVAEDPERTVGGG